MRKLIIFVALFMLLSVPALALDSDSATVTVTMGDVFDLSLTGNWSMHFATMTDYIIGVADRTSVAVSVYANQAYKVTAQITKDWNQSATQSWTLRLALPHTSPTWIVVDTAGSLSIITGNAGHFASIIYAGVIDVELDDIADDCIVTMTAGKA